MRDAITYKHQHLNTIDFNFKIYIRRGTVHISQPHTLHNSIMIVCSYRFRNTGNIFAKLIKLINLTRNLFSKKKTAIPHHITNIQPLAALIALNIIQQQTTININ